MEKGKSMADENKWIKALRFRRKRKKKQGVA